MCREWLYQILRPDDTSPAARWFRGGHHLMATAGIGIMLADTVAPWRATHGARFDAAFHLISIFFLIEYLLRLSAAPAAPSAVHRRPRSARLSYMRSPPGVFDLFGALPGVLNLFLPTPDSILFGVVWVFKFIRYTPGLVGLQRVISRSRQALWSVFLGFGVVLLASASLEYLIERHAQPAAFGSIPAALWWAIATVTTTGYGDIVPQTAAGRILAGVVMICGILVLALSAGILATGFADEMRRFHFLRTWNIVARVPFFQKVGASIIAEVAWLLRPLNYPAGSVVVRRGERGDCMYFIASGEVEIKLDPEPLRLGPGDFFGEIALLTGAPRTATVVAVDACTLLRLDIVEFRELMGRRPDLTHVILDAANRRLDAGRPASARDIEETIGSAAPL
ncbi:MAG TPA: cyclic nucleotide-gated ion channel [Stellaceae bacterium]|jgi:voltage-gated potassium channel